MSVKKTDQNEGIVELVRHVEHLIRNGLTLSQAIAKLSETQVIEPDLVRQLQDLLGVATNNDGSPEVKGQKEIAALIRVLYQHNLPPEKALPALSHGLSIGQNYIRQIWLGLQSLISYAISIIVVASICISIFATKVVPQFKELFGSFGAELPEFTVFVMQVVGTVSELWFLLLPLGVVIYFVKRRIKSKGGALRPIHKFLAVVPGTRSLYRMHFRYLLICYAQILIKGGLEPKAAVDSALWLLDERAVDSPDAGALDALKGTAELEAIGTAYQIDTLASEIEFQLSRTEQDYIQLITKLRERLSGVLQATLGVIIGGIIIAMYLPIFAMGKTL